jgi:hypothetical protein
VLRFSVHVRALMSFLAKQYRRVGDKEERHAMEAGGFQGYSVVFRRQGEP